MTIYDFNTAQGYELAKRKHANDYLFISEYFIAKIAQLHPRSILDIGGGSGYFPVPNNCAYYLLEPSPLITFCRDSSIYKLPMEWSEYRSSITEQRFDLILANGVLFEHLRFEAEDFVHIHKILNDNGYFLFTAVKKYSKNRLRQFLFDKGFWWRGLYKNFTDYDELKNLINRSLFDLKIWEFTHPDGGWTGAHYIVLLRKK